MENLHLRLAGGPSPLSAGHDSRVGHDSERNGNNLTKLGWRAAKAKFKSMSGLNYDDLQIKNKWDALKSKWSMWHQLVGKETGLGWNAKKDNVEASDEWWDKKILVGFMMLDCL